MAGIQLYDIESKSPVDVDPDKVRAAMATGRFAFPKGQNVPVIYNGAPAWIKPEDAHAHVDNLTFTTDDAVRKENAQSEYSGVGGIAKGFAYGAIKGGTLGLAPLVAGAVSPAAREEIANAELGAPRATLAGEAVSLLFDPIAAGSRMFGKGAAGAAAHLPGAPGLAGAAALPAGLPGAAGAVAALPAAGKAAWRKPRMGGPVPVGARGAGSSFGQAPGFGAAAVDVAEEAVPRLGGEVAAADSALGAGKEIRDVGLGRRRALGMGEPETIRAMESPMTLGGPPLESRLMADLRNEQANLVDRRAGIDKLIKSEKKRGKGAGGALDVLGKERADLVSRIEEHEFQLTKYERPEEMALADQSQRAAEQAVMRGPQVSFARGELPGAARDLAAERQGMVTGVGEARAAREAEDAAAAIEAERATVREGGLPSEYVGPEGGAALATTPRRPGLGDVRSAQDAALRELQLGRDAAATSELRASIEADAAAQGVTPGMGMTPAGGQGLALGQSMPPAMAGSPMLGAGPGALPGAAGRALPQLGAGPVVPGAAGGGAAGQAAGVAGGISGAAGGGGGLSLPRAAIESGIYSAATQANNQQSGLEPGGAAEVLKAGALGLGLGAAGHMLGKAFGSSASLAGTGAAGPLAQRAAKAAGGLQDSHLMRMWGIDGAAIERLNREFSELGAGTKGVSNFADFIKATVNDIEALKLANPGDAILQAIPTNRPLRFSDITTERRTAIADALRAKLGKEYDTLLDPAMSAQAISQQGLLAAVQQAEAGQIKGLGAESLKSIAPELAALKDSLKRGETQTVGSLRELRSAMDELFSARNGQHEPFTKAQGAFRRSLDDLVAQSMEAAVPGSSAALGALNREYTMAKILQEGVISAETKFATMSPVNKETLSKAALGASIGQPLGALGFVVGSTLLRGLYNSRGEGFLADLAGSAERSALRISQNPVGAAQAASQSMINARRPVMAFANAQRLVSGTPQEFMSISKAVRALQETKDSSRQEVMRATSNLPVGEQQQAAEHMDAIINALAKELPKGLSMEKALTEQERRYLVFSRSILDPVYATQVLANGGPDSDEAAKAIKSVPGGQQYLESLAEDLRTQINESEELRGNQELFRLQLSLKSKLKTKSNLGTLHGGGGGGGGPKAPSLGMPHVGSSGQAAAIKSIAGTTKP